VKDMIYLAGPTGEKVKKAFDAVAYGACLTKACLSSPAQCLRGVGADLDRDAAGCDQKYGHDSSAPLSRVRHLRCLVGCCARSPLQCMGIRERTDFDACVQRCPSLSARTSP
jgi:hypothetical protein